MRLGSGGNKDTDKGKLYFQDKDIEYLQKKSREVVEEQQNFSVLYFEVDWINSKKNFYGELIYKKFTIPKGIPIKGSIKLEQGSEQMSQGVPNKIMKLTLSIYTQQLDELGVRPKLGDYFGIGNRFYEIFDRTIEDVGVGNVMIDRKQMRLDYKCVQADDEVMFRDAWGNDNLGTESKLRP